MALKKPQPDKSLWQSRDELRPVKLATGCPFTPIGLALGQGNQALVKEIEKIGVEPYQSP